MVEMVGAGVTESLQPDTRHGIEASLAAQATNGSTAIAHSNVLPHKLGWTPADKLLADAAGLADPHVIGNQPGLAAAHPLVKPTVADPAGYEVLHRHADAVSGSNPVPVNNQAWGNVAQPLIDPAKLHPVAVELPHQHAHPALEEVAKPVAHEGHHAHAAQPGQVLHDIIPTTADHAVRGEPEANQGTIAGVLPDPAHLDATTHDKHFSVHLKDGQEQGSAHDGVFGSQNAVLPQSAGYGGVLAQLFSFGLPVACVFAAVAFVLWKRLGDSRSSTSHV